MRQVKEKKTQNNMLIGLETDDGYIIEMVYSVNSKCLCISTQIGCTTGCSFCASGSRGFVRNLSTGEMLEEYMFFAEKGYEIEILHLGGVGEPLRNLDNVLAFKNRIDVKTLQITTSMPDEKSFCKAVNSGFDIFIISLHSMNEETRKRIIPNSMSLPEILTVLERVISEKPELKDVIRVSYLLLGNENTSGEEEDKFLSFAEKLDIRLLLMAYNEVNHNQTYITDMKKYEALIKKIIRKNIKCEDCVCSLSRRDDVGGCGTLYVSKN